MSWGQRTLSMINVAKYYQPEMSFKLADMSALVNILAFPPDCMGTRRFSRKGIGIGKTEIV